uniref:Dynamin n=1 Tax=Anthurium amnicola TaxID=1678845 RepID=A0A1D1YNM3_9ARAE
MISAPAAFLHPARLTEARNLTGDGAGDWIPLLQCPALSPLWRGFSGPETLALIHLLLRPPVSNGAAPSGIPNPSLGPPPHRQFFPSSFFLPLRALLLCFSQFRSSHSLIPHPSSAAAFTEAAAFSPSVLADVRQTQRCTGRARRGPFWPAAGAVRARRGVPPALAAAPVERPPSPGAETPRRARGKWAQPREEVWAVLPGGHRGATACTRWLPVLHEAADQEGGVRAGRGFALHPLISCFRIEGFCSR